VKELLTFKLSHLNPDQLTTAFFNIEENLAFHDFARFIQSAATDNTFLPRRQPGTL
jgi:hypothetical protein